VNKKGISHNSEQYKSPEEFNYVIFFVQVTQWVFRAGSIKMEHLKTTYCAE